MISFRTCTDSFIKIVQNKYTGLVIKEDIAEEESAILNIQPRHEKFNSFFGKCKIAFLWHSFRVF